MKKYKLILALFFVFGITPAIAQESAVNSIEPHLKYQKRIVSQAEERKKIREAKMAKSSSDAADGPVTVKTVCQVKFEDFSDQRQNKETLGATLSRPLMPAGINAWLKDAAADIWQKNLQSSNSGKLIVVKPALNRLYNYSQNNNLFGVMAISVEFTVDGKIVETRKYRGLGSTFNTSDADSEYFDALSYAAHKSMTKALRDIPAICQKTNS